MVPPSTHERNTMQEPTKHVVMDAWKAFSSRDAQRIGAFFTEDAEWIAPQGNATAIAMGYADHIIGREAIAHFIAKEVPKVFVADVSIDFRGFYSDGQTVIVEERMQATLFNGRKYDNDYCFIFELVDGKISQVREYMDTQRGKACIFG
jgi:ketosteroid isomerase-like protein